MSPIGETDDGGAVLRILIVEDNFEVAQTTGWMLEEMGHDYRLAGHPDAAISAAQDYAPHVVLLDIGLPGMNGFDLCGKLRDVPAMDGAVIIAQTGWASEAFRQRGVEAGFDHYLVKPIRINDLLLLIEAQAPQPAVPGH